MIKKREALLATGGLVLFAFAASRIGWGPVFEAIARARNALGIIVVLSIIRLVLQTRSWAIALRLDGIKTKVAELMLIRLASQGVGYLSVLGPFASEPMKISLLKSNGSATAATLVDTGVYWFASGIVGIAGYLSAVLLLAHQHQSFVPMGIVGLGVAGFMFLIARPKLRLSGIVDALGPRCPRWLAKAKQIEVTLRQFESRYPSAIRSMFLLDLACQVLLVAEVITVFWCLKTPLAAGTVLAVEGASRAIKIVAGWMPARIGADESGAAGAFFAFGLSPASGLTLALARRSRDLLAALIGLSWLAWRARCSEASSASILKAACLKEEGSTCKAY